MQVSITNIKSIPQNITIKTSEYYKLKRKADAYDKEHATKRQTMSTINNSRSKQERQQLARKAALARWNKKG